MGRCQNGPLEGAKDHAMCGVHYHPHFPLSAGVLEPIPQLMGFPLAVKDGLPAQHPCNKTGVRRPFLHRPATKGDPDGGAPRNLCCYKSCCDASCQLNCTWEAARHDPETSYKLIFQYHDDKKGENRQSFQAKGRTSLVINQNNVYALKKVTVWVESHSRDRPPLQSENQTLLINEAVKIDAPPAQSISVSRSRGILTVRWFESHQCDRLPRMAEVRLRQENVGNWTLENCTSENDEGAQERIKVTCDMGKSWAYEMQVRYRTSHWSSYWSDWSDTVFVPAEILRSPRVNCTVGRLGEDGLRNVTLEWESPGAEQGEVSYTLTFVLLPCQECLSDSVFTHAMRHQVAHRVALSGAGYNISLESCNKVSCGPISSFLVPPAVRDTGPGAPNVTLSGKHFSLQWRAKAELDGLCFEKQALGDPPWEELQCKEEDLEASDEHRHSGVLEPNRCYRIAVHGRDSARNVWLTFALTHLFPRNTSRETSIPVKVVNRTATSALVQWTRPRGISDCPGVLKKYILCCQTEPEGKTTYYEADASETQHVLPDLQPDTTYRVGVWASTAGSEVGCRALIRFTTSPSDGQQLPLVFLGVYAGLLVAALVTFHFWKKRLKDALCPTLPDPAEAEAVKILPVAEMGSQVCPPRRFVEPLESSHSTEPFVVDPRTEEEEHEEDVKMGSPKLATAVEEAPSPTEDPSGSGSPLACEYKEQGLLSTVEEDPPGREGTGESERPSNEVAGRGCRSPEFC
nr:interleukin-12 receptor subunit beta-1 isoform X2 [Pogona vitticeps]